MSLKNASLFAAIAAVLAVGSAQAQQVVSATGTPGASGSPAVANITFQGTLTSALELRIEGEGSTLITNANNAGLISTGTVDLGTFSTVDTSTLTNANGSRVTAPAAGAIVVADLAATLLYNGATSGSVTVQRTNDSGSSPIAANNVRIAPIAPASWTTGDANTAVPAGGASALEICPTGNCLSNTRISHQIGIFIPDTQPAGTFSTVVTYTGTAL